MIGTAAALLGAASAGSSILGGVFGGNAKKKAAQLQEQAYKSAAARTDQTTQEVNGNIIGAGQASAQQVQRRGLMRIPSMRTSYLTLIANRATLQRTN